MCGAELSSAESAAPSRRRRNGGAEMALPHKKDLGPRDSIALSILGHMSIQALTKDFVIGGEEWKCENDTSSNIYNLGINDR